MLCSVTITKIKIALKSIKTNLNDSNSSNQACALLAVNRMRENDKKKKKIEGNGARSMLKDKKWPVGTHCN